VTLRSFKNLIVSFIWVWDFWDDDFLYDFIWSGKTLRLLFWPGIAVQKALDQMLNNFGCHSRICPLWMNAIIRPILYTTNRQAKNVFDCVLTVAKIWLAIHLSISLSDSTSEWSKYFVLKKIYWKKFSKNPNFLPRLPSVYWPTYNFSAKILFFNQK